MKESPEHFHKRLTQRNSRCSIERSDAFHQSCNVNAAELIDRYLSLPRAESARDTKRELPTRRRERRDHHCLKVAIHLVGTNDDARPRLLHFMPLRRVQSNEIDIETADYHVRSLSASEDSGASSHSRSSSVNSLPCSAITFLIASSQPARGSSIPCTMIELPLTRSVTSSPSPDCSSSVFGSRTPRELPMRTSLALTAPPSD